MAQTQTQNWLDAAREQPGWSQVGSHDFIHESGARIIFDLLNLPESQRPIAGYDLVAFDQDGVLIWVDRNDRIVHAMTRAAEAGYKRHTVRTCSPRESCNTCIAVNYEGTHGNRPVREIFTIEFRSAGGAILVNQCAVCLTALSQAIYPARQA